MNEKITALGAFAALIFYVMKLFGYLHFSDYQMAIGTLLSLWSLNCAMKVFLVNQSYHVFFLFITAGLLTLDSMYSKPGLPSVYLMAVTVWHAVALVLVLFSLPFNDSVNVAHAQQKDGSGIDDE